MFFFVNFEATHSPSTITTNSTLLLPDAQNGIFRYTGRPARGRESSCALAAANGHIATTDPIVAKLLRTSATRRSSGGVLSEITGNLNTERYTFQQPTGGPVYYPTIRMDYNVTSAHPRVGHVLPPAVHRQELRHDEHAAADLAGLPALRHAGLVA